MALPGSAAIPAPYRDRQENAYRTGLRIVDMVREDLKPTDILEGSQGSQGPSEVRYRAHVAFSTAFDLMRQLEQIQNRRKVEPAFCRPNVRDIGHPLAVRGLGCKILVEPIGRNRQLVGRVGGIATAALAHRPHCPCRAWHDHPLDLNPHLTFDAPALRLSW